MQGMFSTDMNVKYLFIVFTYLWGGVEIYQQIRQRKGQRGAPSSRDQGSLILLNVCITLGYCIAVPISFTPYGRLTWGQPLWPVAGLAFVVGGLWIRFSAMRTLAKLFTYAVEIQPQHRLVETGVYRHVRHPGYLGQLFVFLGIGLALANWISLLALLVPIGTAFAHRINVEEQVLREHFAEAYDAYRRRSWRLIPGLY